MKYNPNVHHRKSIRLKGYDYSQAGLYFITICVQDRSYLFGKIIVEVPVGAPVGAPLVGAQFDKFDGRPQGNTPVHAPMQPSATMILNDAGKMIEMEWLALKKRYPNIKLHEYVVMPNHFHGILEIVVGAPLVGAQNLMAQNSMAQNSMAQNSMAQNLMAQNSMAQNSMAQNSMAQNNGDVQNETDNGQSNVIGRPQGHAPTCAKTVGDMMDAFKSITTVEYIHGLKQSGWEPFNGKLWQRNYYEHIIRDEPSYHRISEYIINNPAKWQKDKFFKE